MRPQPAIFRMRDYMSNHGQRKHGMLGDVLRARMSDANITIERMAEHPACKNAGVNVSRITYLRHSKAKNPLELRNREPLNAIAAVLGIPVADLFVFPDGAVQNEPTEQHVAPKPVIHHPVIPDSVSQQIALGLAGPKRLFLLEAISYAYQEAIAPARRGG